MHTYTDISMHAHMQLSVVQHVAMVDSVHTLEHVTAQKNGEESHALKVITIEMQNN